MSENNLAPSQDDQTLSDYFSEERDAVFLAKLKEGEHGISERGETDFMVWMRKEREKYENLPPEEKERLAKKHAEHKEWTKQWIAKAAARDAAENMPKTPVKKIKTTPVKKIPAKQRTSYLAMLTIGYCRSTAAAKLGRESIDFDRWMMTDADFARQVKEAEAGIELFALERVRLAAADPEHWRAAAWLLERRLPGRFAPVKTGKYSEKQVAEFLEEIMKITSEYIPDDSAKAEMSDRLLSHFQDIENRGNQ